MIQCCECHKTIPDREGWYKAPDESTWCAPCWITEGFSRFYKLVSPPLTGPAAPVKTYTFVDAVGGEGCKAAVEVIKRST